jgi:hypothetical protein
MNWLDPWKAVEGEEKKLLEQELLAELCTHHVLYSVPLELIGRSLTSDEVLVRLRGVGHQYAVVHLTWKPETSADWPRAEFFSDMNEFVETRMKRDNWGH